MYGYGSLKQRITCLFNKFRPYNKIASKGCVGGLKEPKLSYLDLEMHDAANCIISRLLDDLTSILIEIQALHYPM